MVTIHLIQPIGPKVKHLLIITITFLFLISPLTVQYKGTGLQFQREVNGESLCGDDEDDDSDKEEDCVEDKDEDEEAECPENVCEIVCPGGFKAGENGCELCEGNEVPGSALQVGLFDKEEDEDKDCLLYTSPTPPDATLGSMPW